MTGQTPDARSILEAEMLFGVRKRERLAWSVAIGGLAIGLLGLGSVVALLPLKETQAFLTIVDKDTGTAERVVSVEAAGVEQTQAITQSLLYTYVTNRETYDANDNEPRILKVYRASEARAKSTLVSLWSEENEAYPPTLYGDNAKVSVRVTSITPVTEATAQVRFLKTLERPGEPPREGKFTATVTYRFAPTRESAIELVWQNPTGFLVTDYRVTADRFEEN